MRVIHIYYIMMESLHYANISKYITIVIPTKNEEKYIQKTLEQISFQYGAAGIKIIIADADSTDKTVEICKNFSNKNHIDIEIIRGGLPAVGRNMGAKLVKTPYILFIDADITFTKRNAIQLAFQKILNKKLWLLSTTPIYKGSFDWKARWMFTLNKVFTWYLSLVSPFAIGAFTLIKTDVFMKVGGYDERAMHSEDWLFSKDFLPHRFGIVYDLITQDNRRFKKYGYLNMIKLVWKNWKNRNNKNYFYENINYWL